jgi:hypothetical protein
MCKRHGHFFQHQVNSPNGCDQFVFLEKKIVNKMAIVCVGR